MFEYEKKYFCPRLLDYIIIVGSRHPNRDNNVVQTPELLRRYPVEDHKDFILPTDVVFFCQPEGCTSVGPKRVSLREMTSFVFTLTEKDAGIARYGICMNFYRAFDRKSHSKDKSVDKSVDKSTTNDANTNTNTNTNTANGTNTDAQKTHKKKRKSRTRLRNHSLTSLCILSHHPFFSSFRDCLSVLRKIVDSCHERSCARRKAGSRSSPRDTVWGILTGQGSDTTSDLSMHEVREIETWILRLLSAPVPVPLKTRVQVQIVPKDLQPPLLFALPDHTRFSLIDFPLHLPLELLGVDTCLSVLTCIMLEYKLVLQSRDYNALTMSVMAFVSMLHPLEYMFPVIPLLPTCMSSAEQLLLAPTPFIIGVPASFFLYKKNFKLPDDVWLVDLDSNKLYGTHGGQLPPLPEQEVLGLKNHLKQALASMSMTPQPIKNLDALAQNPEILKRRESFSSQTGFNPLIYGNDVDSVDVATRVAMIEFFNSPNILGNFAEHTRTLRLYPRPVVAFQLPSFLRSRPIKTNFINRFARTQAVEYFAEWNLCPQNVVFLRVQTSVYDPAQIGDKPKWYAQQLSPVEFSVYDETSSLGAALTASDDYQSDDVPTDESGDISDGAESNSSSYSSLSDFVTDIVNSHIDGDTPSFYAEDQVLAVDQSKVYTPPQKLQFPTNIPIMGSDSAFSLPESDVSSSGSSSPSYSIDQSANKISDGEHFKFDSGIVTNTSSATSFARSGSKGDSPNTPPARPPPPVLSRGNSNGQRNLNSAFEAYQKSKVTNPTTVDKVINKPSSPASLNRQTSSSSNSSFKRNHLTPKINVEQENDRPTSPGSIISTISNELNDLAQTTSHTLSGFFSGSRSASSRSSAGSANGGGPKAGKPFAPLGNKKALVEKSGLVKHATGKKTKDSRQAALDIGVSHSENQQFLKDIVETVKAGQGVSIFKQGRVKKLMEDENYRNLVVSQINMNLERKNQSNEEIHIPDVPLSRPVFKGMANLAKFIVYGLEQTCHIHHGQGGMSSAFMLLEILHTHYWQKDLSRSDQSEMGSLFGSQESLNMRADNGQSRSNNNSLVPDNNMVAATGSSVIVNGNEYENIELQTPQSVKSEDQSRMILIPSTNSSPQDKPPNPDNPNYPDPGEYLREMVRNRDSSVRLDQIKKMSSIDSEMSEGSTVISTTSDNLTDDSRRISRINHHSIRSTFSDTEVDARPEGFQRERSASLWSSKSSLSTGFRYHDGRSINTCPLPSPESGRMYLFECLTGKDRTKLWDSLQFWEDVFLDSVAQERDIIGMDQGPGEMMERYNSMSESDQKRLEHDEDKLLSVMLFNLVAFMVMMLIKKHDIKRKIRRLLGKSHIGLAQSQCINEVLDQIHNLHGNDIDLKSLGSRQMTKQSFSVHWGTDNKGDMFFMEVCDDCLILRRCNSSICDRWWYEKLINMTYCPKTKVLCLWRKIDDQVQLNQFYTKKCKDLYFKVKDAMERASIRNRGVLPDQELGGEFPITDMETGQGGLLQVCMEGIGLLFANSKCFIHISHVTKCRATEGVYFVFEEIDPKTKEITQRKFKSNMALTLAIMIHRAFTVQPQIYSLHRHRLLSSCSHRTS